MAVEVHGTIKPKNNGTFPVVMAENVEHQGQPLTNFIPVLITQEDYNSLVEADEVDPDLLYFITLDPNGDD